MTDERPTVLTDELIERALNRRAPVQADLNLLRAIVAAAEAAPQRSGRTRIGPLSRRGVAWIGVAAAVMLGGTLVLTGGGGRRTSVPPTSPSASTPGLVAEVPTPTQTPVTAGCAADTATVADGANMPTVVADPAAIGPGIADGAYVTGVPGDSNSQGPPFDIWSTQGGTTSRVAVVDGPGVNFVQMNDISPDGSELAFSVGHVSLSGASVECSDVYLIGADGEGLVRVTRSGPGTSAYAVRFSSDGRSVAWTVAQHAPQANRFGHYDRTAAERPSTQICSGSNGIAQTVATTDWNPHLDVLAVLCGHALALVRQADVETMDIAFDAGDASAAGWTDDTHYVVVVPGSGDTDRFLDIWTFELNVTSPAEPTRHRIVVPFDPVRGDAADNHVSADGKSAIQTAGTKTGDLSFELVNLATGAASPIGSGAIQTPSWSPDGRSIVWAGSATGRPELHVQDLASGSSTTAPLPAGYANGVWRP